MNPDLPLTVVNCPTLGEPHSSVRSIARERSLSPPRPDLPSKWREKRKQVWSVAPLRPELVREEPSQAMGPSTTGETASASDTWSTSVLPTERSVGNALRSAFGGERHATTARGPSRQLAPLLERHVDARVIRVLQRSGTELYRGSSAVMLPVGMCLAGAGLIAASGLQLLVILPAQLLRRSLIRFARFTIRQSGSLKRRTRSQPGELVDVHS